MKLVEMQENFRRLVETYDVHPSFGEHFSDAVPATSIEWQPTRQPIVVSKWLPADSSGNLFTTVMYWTSYKPLEFEGWSYGQKDVEFERFVDLPELVPETNLEIAVNSGKTRQAPREFLAHKGWQVVHPDDICPDLDGYRDYIRNSKAERSVAKNGYVVGQSVWFSCRSVCYLAAGRPVVVQETGFSKVLPTGEGIISFSDMNEAVNGIRDIENHYARHSRVARAIVEEYFDSKRVLSQLIDTAMACENAASKAVK